MTRLSASEWVDRTWTVCHSNFRTNNCFKERQGPTEKLAVAVPETWIHGYCHLKPSQPVEFPPPSPVFFVDFYVQSQNF